jgi:hypothetical protein
MRDKMEMIKTPSTEPYVAVGVDFLNTLLRSDDEWRNPEKLKKEINLQFENALSKDELDVSYDLRTDLDVFKVIMRIQQLTGLKVRDTTASCLTELSQIPGMLTVCVCFPPTAPETITRAVAEKY